MALKVIRQGLESDGMRSRFEAERQTLASLDHPNISKLFDAGTTEAGRSYFVMELVPGTRINRYCDDHQMTVRARVELYIKVCRAVHHAHQKGIIHRDLKPSNILVSDVDGTASPKVIDFGVARAVTGEGSGFEGLEVLGTPQYMSPEQMGSDQAGADIRSDVYALGAMLYELLSGLPALDLHGQQLRTIQDLRSLFANEPMVSPSRRLMAPALEDDERNAIAQSRRIDAAKLCKSLRQDLDWIILKAIARERTTRYDSVAALADDLQRFLENRPVVASPQGKAYAFGRFYRRNKTVMLFSTALAASLIASLLVVFLLLIKTTRARDEAIAQEQEKIKLLRDSYIQQAAATMQGHTQGRRLKAFEAIRAAAQIRPVIESRDQLIELRNQAIACMSIPDVELATTVKVPQSAGKAAYTRNGDRYAYVGTDNAIHILRTADQVQILQISPIGKRPADSWLFSPDGRYLVFNWDQQIPSLPRAFSKRGFEIWDLNVNRSVLSKDLNWPPGDFNCRSDQWVTVDEDARMVLIYDLHSGLSIKEIPDIQNVGHVIYSPDGDRIAMACNDDCSLRILDVASGATIVNLPTGAGFIRNIAWSPNGFCVAVTGDNPVNQIQVFDARTGAVHTRMHGALGAENGNTYSLDGRFLLTGGWDWRVRLWDARRGDEILNIPRYGEGVFFQDSTHFANPVTSGLETWNLITGRECRAYSGLTAEASGSSSFISPDGKLLAASMNTGVRLWDVETQKTYAFVAADSILCIAFSPDGSTLYASTPKQVLHWNVAAIAGREEVADGHDDNGWRTVAMDLSRDGQTMVWGKGSDLFVGDPTTGSWSKLVGPELYYRRFLAVSPDGKWAATSPRYADHFEVWDLTSHKQCTTIARTHAAGDLGPVAFSPDSKTLVVDQGGSDRWFRVSDWKLIHSIDRNPLNLEMAVPQPIALSPDGKFIASGTQKGETLLEDAKTYEVLAAFETPATPQIVSSIAFSPDATKLILTGGGTVTVWDIPLVRHELDAIGLNWH